VKSRLAAIVGIVVFTVLASTGIGYALWSSNAQTTGTAKAVTLSENCTAPTKLVNGGFETPNISPDPYRLIPSPFITGWTVVNDNAIEVWRSQLGSTPPEGAQIIELSGNALGTAYQVVATTPGQTLRWSLKHRGREGNDTMRVSINANGGALVQQAQFTTGMAAWSTQQGVYVVPAGQTSTRISLTSVSTNGGNVSVGNLVDDVTFGTGPCLTAASTITNITTGTSTYRVGDVVEYATVVTNSGGAHAESSVFTTSVPTGLTFVPGSITINGVAKSDSSGNDEANISGTTITARLGQGATASAGGAIPPDNAVTVRFRATIQSSAAGGNLSYTSTTAYADALAPAWPMSAVSPALTTPVTGVADIAVAVNTLPQLGAGSANQVRSWVFDLTNNGPSGATGVSVVVTVPSNMSARTVTISGGGGASCTAVSGANTSTCTVPGTMASGTTRTITYTGNMGANPMNTYSVSLVASSTSYDNVPANNSVTGSVQYDNQAPATPLNFTATRASATQINLAWQSSNDNVAVVGYRIYRNGVLVHTTTGTGTTYNDTGLASHLPYWYWVQAIDAAGNASPSSNGEGAVTYAEDTSYRVQYLNNTSLCVVAPSNTFGGTIVTGSCSTTSSALRQWKFDTVSGDDVYVQFNSGNDRRWRGPNTASGTDVIQSTIGLTGTETQWRLGAYWTGSQAVVEFRRTANTNVCLDVDGASTTAGGIVQQWDCNTTMAQRFALVQP
jgi:uncharacterized repeat protein (TIGR01451 family)